MKTSTSSTPTDVIRFKALMSNILKLLLYINAHEGRFRDQDLPLSTQAFQGTNLPELEDQRSKLTRSIGLALKNLNQLILELEKVVRIDDHRVAVNVDIKDHGYVYHTICGYARRLGIRLSHEYLPQMTHEAVRLCGLYGYKPKPVTDYSDATQQLVVLTAFPEAILNVLFFSQPHKGVCST